MKTLLGKKYALIGIAMIVSFVFNAFWIVSANSFVTYKDKYDGTNGFEIVGKSNTDCIYEYGKEGFAGKTTDDKVYYYSSTNASTGNGYFSVTPSINDNTHDADSTVIEFSFLLKDENSTFYFSPAFYNDTGYEYFLENGKLVGTSGLGLFKSLNGFLQFSSNGIYVYDTTGEYVDPLYRGTYLGKNKKLNVGVWHTVAIRTPGLINSKGELVYDEYGNVIEGVYAGEKEIYIYVDGEEYTVPLTKQIYGTRHIKMHGKGELYMDNIMMYMTNQLASPADYKNAAKCPEINSSDNYIKVKDNVVAYGKSITVAQLKNALSGSDAVSRVYTDNTCEISAEDSKVVEPGMVVVVAAKNGCDTEKCYAYYTVEELMPFSVSHLSLSDAEGKKVYGKTLDSVQSGLTYYLDTVIENNEVSEMEPIHGIVASYDKSGELICCKIKDIVVSPGENEFSALKNKVTFENITVSPGGRLKAFLWFASTGKPLCPCFEVKYESADDEYHILSFGNSYSSDSFAFLPQIAAADGIKLYAVNMYQGGCPIETHYKYMKGSGTYEKRIEYFPDGTTKTTENVSFADGLATPGYRWDYITMHQKGQFSPFFERYYTDEKPYITEMADYIKENSGSGEVLFFENWPVYTDRVIEKYESVYKPIVEGLEKEEYVPAVFKEIKSCYLKAAEKIGNSGRIIPAGEAVYLAITKYGFEEYVDNTANYEDDDSFKSGARAMFRDKSSHMTIPYGRVLVALTWYEYLTGNDARNNPYTHSDIPADDMKLLKEIAHEACSMPEYNPE